MTTSGAIMFILPMVHLSNTLPETSSGTVCFVASPYWLRGTDNGRSI